MSLRVLLADDRTGVRESLKSFVNSQRDMHVVGEAANGEDAVGIARGLLPDVIVMELSMSASSGAAAAARLGVALPALKVVMLTAHEAPLDLAQLLGAGACGYVLKRSAAADVVYAIRAAVAGGIYIDPAVTSTVVQGYLKNRHRHDEDAPGEMQ
jgi:DNA-binding NarL/FixJ family response regulator